MREAEKRLDSFGIGYETRIMSAHRTPERRQSTPRPQSSAA
jgi:Phosphoribosylcarboxyaminoimidazole (NCAIR) mutase